MTNSSLMHVCETQLYETKKLAYELPNKSKESLLNVFAVCNNLFSVNCGAQKLHNTDISPVQLIMLTC